MCEELCISQLETVDEAELKAGGYHAVGAAPEFRKTPVTSKVLTGDPTGRAPIPEKDRKPHLMNSIFFQREREGKSTHFTHQILACVRSMEEAICSTDPGFVPQLPPSGKKSSKGWGLYVRKHRRKLHKPMLEELEHWYEAVHILVVSWKEAEDATATMLRMFGCDQKVNPTRTWPAPVQRLLLAFWETVPVTFPRFEHLKTVLLQKYASHSSKIGMSFRGIVFVHQRVMTHVLAHIIASDPKLNKLFSTACLYAFSSPATVSLSVSKTEAQKLLSDFSSGLVNLLITTVVAEEGMDVPAANCVIRFDAMEHAVSLVQGRGRARQEDSSFVVMSERLDRPATLLAEVEQDQLRLVREFNPSEAGKSGFGERES
ncbi:unnamed protein product [Choristocarpus tenellus]